MLTNLFFADSEVFHSDTLWCFKRASDGKHFSYWNDPQGVIDFIEAENPILCGYNFRGYDAHILKATLLGWTPQGIYDVNRTIIFDDDALAPYRMFKGSPWITLPPIVDLFHDIVPRKGLKEIEANIGMAIVESSVSFDLDRPLTQSEQAEVECYCWHDVDATEKLYRLRKSYIDSKIALCELQGVDPLTMLQHTNGRVIAEVLGAEKLDEIPYEEYQVPSRVDRTAIPQQALDYCLAVNTENCTVKGENSIEFMFHDCPTKVALGGIHAAVPSYKESSTDERIVFIQDIGSFYPSLILNENYMSRAVSDGSVYKQFYDLRMEAKAKGDTATADAAKLALNGTFGILKSEFSNMFDPMQGTSVCLSGQLYMMDLIEQLYRAVPDGMTLIQLNTDGWVLSCLRSDYQTILDTVAAWSERTNLTVDTDEIHTIIQANVNNYVMQFADGKIKAKGGVVANQAKGKFTSNSATIIDHAVTQYLLDDVPIADAINACDDPMRFQIVAKGGHGYAYIQHGFDILQKVNRVFAGTDTTLPPITKVKVDADGTVHPARIPLTPDHCFVVNEDVKENAENILTRLDKQWYIELATRKAKEFITRDAKEKAQMADVIETTNELQKPTPKRKAKETKKETVEIEEVTPILNIDQKLVLLQKEMAVAAQTVKFDGFVQNMSYEYADTQQYKAWLSSACTALGLVFGFSVECTFPIIVSPDSARTPIYGAQANADIIITDADSGDVRMYMASGFGSNVQVGYCSGVAQTNALRNFILNNYLLDNKGRDGDDQKAMAPDDTKPMGFVSPETKGQLKNNIIADGKEDAKFATDMFVNALYKEIVKAQAIDPAFAVKLVAEHFNADGTPILGENGKSTLGKAKAVKFMNKAEEIVSAGANNG